MTARLRDPGLWGWWSPTLRGSRPTLPDWCDACVILADGFAALFTIVIAGMALPRPLAATTGVLLAAIVLLFIQESHHRRRIAFWTVLRDVLGFSMVGFTANILVDVVLDQEERPGALLLTWAVFALAVLVMRWLARRALSAAGLWQLRALVVGTAESAPDAIGALLSEPGLGYSIVGVIRPLSLAEPHAPGFWRSLLQSHRADLLVVASHPLDGLDGAMDSLVRDRIPFAVVPRPNGLPMRGLHQTDFFSRDTVLFTYRNNLAQPVARFTKLIFDLGFAAILVVFLSPVLLGIGILVMLDGGPPLYRHTRIEAGGRRFACLKFRSMVRNSDAVLRGVLASDPAAAVEWRATHKLRHDPRVTWIGRHLRKTSLDELPQLFNVLRLEMSLVGPRPIVDAEIERYGRDIAFYYETRPGLSGLWQVSGRSDTGYAERVRLDTWYVKNWTIWHDLAILAKTVPAVLKRRGAV